MNIETFYNTRVYLKDYVKNYLDTFEPNLYIIKKLIFILFILLINA